MNKMMTSKLWLYLFGVLSTFFTPIIGLMCAIFVLMLIDLICGVSAAYKQKIKIQSKKLKASIVKVLFYFLALITANLLSIYFIPAIPWINITMGLIATTEVLSIFENISIVTGTNFIKKMKEVVMAYIDKWKPENKKDQN